MDSENNMGRCANPIFSYQAGMVWMLEQGLMKSCATVGNLNVDHQISLMFSDKLDARDKRPMVYPGRILTAAGKLPSEMWKKSKLLSMNRADLGPQLQPHDVGIMCNLQVGGPPSHNG